jgi:SPP1 family predicted phage head-tail adaptor
MNAGKLRERVRFAKRTDSDDGYGNVNAEFVTRFTAAARIMPLRGGEDVMAARLAGKQPMLITVRRSVAALEVTTDWQATDARNGAIYNIRTVSPSEDKILIDMICESGVAT